MKVILLIMISFSIAFSADTFNNTKTGLQWQDNSDAKSVRKDWSDAKSYCQNLNLAGKSDWRLPIIKELQSIVDIKKYDPAIKKSFKNIASSPYWSSSEYLSDDSSGWGVDFYFGYTSWYGKSVKYYVRCVRGRQ